MYGWVLLAIALIGMALILLSNNPAQGPRIQILSDTEKYINTTYGTLIFYVSDNSGGTITCDIELNGAITGTVNVSSGTQHEEPLTLSQGENTIRVKATDQAGHSTWSNTFTVHVDVESPEVVIIDFRATR